MKIMHSALPIHISSLLPRVEHHLTELSSESKFPLVRSRQYPISRIQSYFKPIIHLTLCERGGNRTFSLRKLFDEIGLFPKTVASFQFSISEIRDELRHSFGFPSHSMPLSFRDGDGVLLGLSRGRCRAFRHVVIRTHIRCHKRMEAEGYVLSFAETRHGVFLPRLFVCSGSNDNTANASVESNNWPSSLPRSACNAVSKGCHTDISHRRAFQGFL